MTPISVVVADLILQLGRPLPEAYADHEHADLVFETWREYTPSVPAPSILAACRRVASDEALIRLVNRLAWEGTLTRYAEGDKFLRLVEIFAGADRRKVA